MQPKIYRQQTLSNDLLLELESIEVQTFGDGALNRWTLPVIAKYGYLYLIEIEKEIIGLATFIRKDDKVFLIGLWIKQQFRNSGFAQKFLTYIKSDLVDMGVKEFELTADENNKAAMKIYAKLGFIEQDRLKDFYGPNIDRVLLSVNLLK